MNQFRHIVLLILCSFFLLPAQAKKTKPEEPIVTKDSLSIERLQQFTYYWYAAKQVIEQQEYVNALVYLEVCNVLNPDDGETLRCLGILYDGVHKPERAFECFKRAYEVAPRDQWHKYSMALLELGKDYVPEAIAVLEHSYEIQRQVKDVDEELLDQLRRLYIHSEKWSQALAIQDSIDNLKGYDAYSALYRYRIYLFSKKPKKALAELDKYLKLEPQDLQFLLMRMELLEHLNAKKSDLYAMYERILALQPNHLMVLNNYAYHLATNKGDLKKAERMSAITIREEPDNAVYLDTYGWIMYKQGQKDLAIFYLTRAKNNAKDEATKTEVEQHLKKAEGKK